MQPKASRLLARLHHGHHQTPNAASRLIRTQARGMVTTSASRASSATMLRVSSDIARRLDEMDIWRRGKGRKKAGALRAVEPRRVNIVSEGLCGTYRGMIAAFGALCFENLSADLVHRRTWTADDIVKYIGPSIERHRGCDLVDLNPGVGAWSRKLHDCLQPRKHIMMDLDAELYSPFMGDMLARKNVELIPKSGFVWKDLLEMMETRLSEQPRASPPGAALERNDTLLVTANLCAYPKKAFLGFDSMNSMILYQFLSSIRTSTLFQKYGLVRMLIWVNDEDKRKLVPRSNKRRRKIGFEAEISTEWIHEVAGLDTEVEDRLALRDEWINIESSWQTLQRMRAAGLEVPLGRGTLAQLKVSSEPELCGQRLAGVRPPLLSRPFMQELEELQQGPSSGSAESAKRLKLLQQRERTGNAHHLTFLELLRERDRIMALAGDPASAAEFREADAAWDARIGNLKTNPRDEFNSIKDSYHLFRQSPPVLLWDRRAYEPLSVRAEEFFPNAPMALLDIQPKAMNPLFLQHGPNSSRAGDMSEVMLRYWFHHTLIPVQKAMEGIWGGFGDLIDECPSVRDVARGGTPMTGHGALTVRAMNEGQWAEILQAWMNWPFRPKYSQMVGRLIEEAETDSDEDEFKAGGVSLAF